MIKIVYRVIIKQGKKQEFEKLAEEVLIPEAKKIPGCRRFSLFQNLEKIQEFIFYEEWESKQDVSVYKQKLIEELGETAPGQEFPIKFNELIEEDEDLV